MKKFLKEGGVSKYNLGDDNFDHSLIKPTKRKQNSTTETLIDNFFTKTSYGASTDITQQNDKRKTLNRLSKEKSQNKENVSLLINKRKSNDNKDTKNKDKKSK